MKEKISLISLGCAKNIVDSEVLIGGLKSENYESVWIWCFGRVDKLKKILIY